MQRKYRATQKDKKYIRLYKQGKSIGFTMRSSLKAKGLIPRANGTYKISNKYHIIFLIRVILFIVSLYLFPDLVELFTFLYIFFIKFNFFMNNCQYHYFFDIVYMITFYYAFIMCLSYISI